MVLGKQNNLKAKANMGQLKGTQVFYIMKYSITIENRNVRVSCISDDLFCHDHMVTCHGEVSVTYPGEEENGNDDGVAEIWTVNGGCMEGMLSGIYKSK